jgi:hypothetical protein
MGSKKKKFHSLESEDKQPSSQVQKESANLAQNQDKTVFVPINIEKIQEIAYDISQRSMTLDEINWLISENELRIAGAIVSDENPLKGAPTNSVKIDLTRIIEKPLDKRISALAENVANRQESIQQRHWDLAFRQYLINSLKF